MNSFDNKIIELENLIKKSSSTVVFTGAGISTLSGIPDFRGKHGVYTDPWNGMDVEQILDIGFFNLHPDIFYSWAKDVWYRLEDYKPNIVHNVLTKLEGKGYIDAIFTQNIDMLHSRAGSKKVYEVHGSAKHHYCTKCNKYYSYEEIAPLVRDNKVPTCSQCGGVIKPDIVFYGESLDNSILMRAYNMFGNCDLTLILGSSLTVQPAASFPLYTLRSGGKIVIVNQQPTSYDSKAELCFDDLKKTFEPLSKFADSLEKKRKI